MSNARTDTEMVMKDVRGIIIEPSEVELAIDEVEGMLSELCMEYEPEVNVVMDDIQGVLDEFASRYDGIDAKINSICAPFMSLLNRSL